MPGNDSAPDEIKGVPDHSEEEADRIFREYIATRDVKHRDKRVLMHQNLVRYLAGKFANRGEPVEDLVQVGLIGLINAIDRYDPARGTKFSTYATPTVVGEIRRHFRDRAWSLKVPRRLQELNILTNKSKEELRRKLGRTPTIEEIAEHLGVSEEETLEAMELGNAYDTVSLDARTAGDGDSAQMTLAEFLGGNDIALDSIEDYGDLEQAMGRLDPREWMIIYCRYFEDMSQTDVAKKLNISQMHVSRLQQKALRKLKQMLSS